MNIRALSAAIATALVGTALWAALLSEAGREFDILACLVGALIGLAAARLHARGTAAAALCGLLAIASVISGKAIGTKLAVKSALPSAIAEAVTRSTFDEEVEIAADLAENEGDIATFVSEWGYSKSDASSEVTEAELATFNRSTAPRLRWIHVTAPTYDEWRPRYMNDLRGEIEQTPFVALFRVVTDSEEPFDLLFDLLFLLIGGFAAFELVRRAEASRHFAGNV